MTTDTEQEVKQLLGDIITDPMGTYVSLAQDGIDIPRHRMASSAVATLGANRNRKSTKRVERAHTDGVDRNIAARDRARAKLQAKRTKA